nr:MAG TPA: hypothetical protein [Caudoviricetes sp.]
MTPSSTRQGSCSAARRTSPSVRPSACSCGFSHGF